MLRPLSAAAVPCALLLAACRPSPEADRAAAAPAPAPPVTTAPARTSTVATEATGVGVDDTALRALLAYEYGEAVDLAAWWPADPDNVEPERAGIPQQRRICADSGAGDPRWIAICTRYGGDEAIGAPADVDLLRVRNRGGNGEPGLWIDLQSTGVDSGADGEPGAIDWLAIGPGRHAFAVHARRHGLGRERAEQVTLYTPVDGRFEPALTLGTRRDNLAGCDPQAGDCEVVECRLRFGTDADAAGFHPLQLQIRAQRGDRIVERTLPIPRVGERYAPPEALRRDGCEPG
jgi:hypothetical protein